MSNQEPLVPSDPRARAFLEMFPNAKLDGFEMVPASALGDPRLINPQPKEPEPPKSGTITSEKLAVIVAVGDNVHEFVLDKLQRATVLALIVKMHGGTPHLHAQPIENLNVEAFAPKIHGEHPPVPRRK